MLDPLAIEFVNRGDQAGKKKRQAVARLLGDTRTNDMFYEKPGLYHQKIMGRLLR
jgi:hypothetical protein